MVKALGTRWLVAAALGLGWQRAGLARVPGPGREVAGSPAVQRSIVLRSSQARRFSNTQVWRGRQRSRCKASLCLETPQPPSRRAPARGQDGPVTGRSVSSFDLLGTGPAELQPGVDEPFSKGSVLGFTGSFGNSRFPGRDPEALSQCVWRGCGICLRGSASWGVEEAALEWL